MADASTVPSMATCCRSSDATLAAVIPVGTPGALERPASQPKRVQSCAAARTATTQTAHPASANLGTVGWVAGMDQSLLRMSRGYYDLIRDRKSTRLNSSHITISYAVFCLKKKKKKKNKMTKKTKEKLHNSNT